jgi:CubicO group peptidase (beta-lactamase class C family)
MRRAVVIGSAVGLAVAGGAWLWRHQGELASNRPVNEWTFTHMDRVMPTDVIPRPARPSDLETGGHLPEVRYSFDGRSYSLAELHRRTHTTSFLVVHRGRVLAEEYPGWFADAGVRFQLFSLTKSVTSLLIGIALERGEIASIDDPVVTYCPQLRGSGYDGPTIDHLLNMSSGVGGLEDWTVPDAPINRFSAAVMTGGSVLDVIRSLPVVEPPGRRFNYSTIDSHVLGWVLEAATGRTLAQNAAERLWMPMGAEHDGFYFLTRGRPRTALGGGSLNASTRDLARIGLLMANGGRAGSVQAGSVRAGSVQVVPEAWVRRSRGSDASHLEVGALGPSGYPHYGYANHWWTLGGAHRAFTGLGVHGQYLWVDPDRETVIVKTSAWNDPDDADRDRETVAALSAVVDAVAQNVPDPSPR